MTVTPISADTAGIAPISADTADAASPSDDALFGGLLDALGSASTSLRTAQSAEQAFAGGSGGLQEMVFERARADAILTVASTAASKATQSLATVLNMQV